MKGFVGSSLHDKCLIDSIHYPSLELLRNTEWRHHSFSPRSLADIKAVGSFTPPSAPCNLTSCKNTAANKIEDHKDKRSEREKQVEKGDKEIIIARSSAGQLSPAAQNLTDSHHGQNPVLNGQSLQLQFPLSTAGKGCQPGRLWAA